MSPPFHLAADPNLDWIIFIIGAVFCLYWLRALRLAREGARLFLRNVAKAVIVFCAAMLVLSVLRPQTNWKPREEQFAAGLAAFLFYVRFESATGRSRYIRAATKRTVIARDLKGERYDPGKHHIDHVWPFSRGGSNTADNLRVIEKEKNLQKGAKRPRMRDMW